MGTYIAPVPTFVNAYMEQLLQNEQDQGNEDYSLPNEVQYTECYRQVIQNKEYWLQVGCTDGTSQALSVNIYQDNTCTTRSTVNGFDDSNIDVSQLQVSMYWNGIVYYFLQTYSFHTKHLSLVTLQEMPTLRQLGRFQRRRH
jgi:hypothetical protein